MAKQQIKLKLKQGMDGQWYPAVKAANGEITFTGEGYKVRHDGLRQYAKNLASLARHLAGKTTGEIQRMIEVLPRE
ncbi:MAG: hypothetical protein GX591_02380 [Planctomycetes bacterium]|nr:hypothetical protein [Planctomycetota bacterium]